MNNVHILNGDALFASFPAISGEKIILRECLIEGNLSGNTWEEFVKNRQIHIEHAYAEPKHNYTQKVVVEFDKIRRIKENSSVFLWFEDDLFCQVNFWFVCSLLVEKAETINCFFVRAKPTELHGFGGMNESELIQSYQSPIIMQVTDIKLFTHLWEAYRNNDAEMISHLATALADDFQFVKAAIDASLKFIPDYAVELNYYELQILDMLIENEAITFGKVFQRFSKSNSILGLGDLQVKRLYDKVIPYV